MFLVVSRPVKLSKYEHNNNSSVRTGYLVRDCLNMRFGYNRVHLENMLDDPVAYLVN